MNDFSPRTLKKLFIGAVTALAALPLFAYAHEAYVLPTSFFWQGIHEPFDMEAFGALKNPHDLLVTLQIAGGILALIFINFLFRLTDAGSRFHKFLERFAYLGPLFVRAAIASAFFFGAQSGAFLGPELSLSQMPYGHVMQWLIYLASAMIFFGVFTEIAAFIGLCVFTIGFVSFGGYLVTYLNYLGELIVLFLFGMRTWSFDGWFFGPLKDRRARWDRYGTAIVRIFYGAALLYAGITVKLLDSNLMLRVIHDWNLTQFHWLFPSDPLLVVLGAGLAEALIGIFIIFGFEMRMTVVISLFYITLSLLYFRELVWPHILLYGISLNLIVQPELFTLDHLFFRRERKKIPFRRRLFGPYVSAENDIEK